VCYLHIPYRLGCRSFYSLFEPTNQPYILYLPRVIGKFSFPIIHCVRQDTSDTRLLSILKQRTEDVDVKRYAQTLMKEAGSLAYTRKKCAALKQEIVTEIEALGGNESLLKIISLLDVQLESMAANTTDTSKRNELHIDSA
jgi:geranylgeranyl diphosphate synthase type 3